MKRTYSFGKIVKMLLHFNTTITFSLLSINCRRQNLTRKHIELCVCQRETFLMKFPRYIHNLNHILPTTTEVLSLRTCNISIVFLSHSRGCKEKSSTMTNCTICQLVDAFETKLHLWDLSHAIICLFLSLSFPQPDTVINRHTFPILTES